VLIVVLVAFGLGFAAGSRPVGDLTQRLEQAEQGAAELEAQMHAQRALALLHQTVVDVDARNFGIANERLSAAVAALDRVDRDRVATDAAELEAIRNELAALDIRVAADLAGQRATLAELIRRLTAALGG